MPPRGSLQDRLLREVIERERYADYRKHTFLGRSLVLAIRGAPTRYVASLEEELALAIFQTAFDADTIQQRLDEARKQARQRRDELLRDARMLERVASYSETGEDQEQTQQHADVFARRLAERAAKKDE